MSNVKIVPSSLLALPKITISNPSSSQTDFNYYNATADNESNATDYSTSNKWTTACLTTRKLSWKLPQKFRSANLATPVTVAAATPSLTPGPSDGVWPSRLHSVCVLLAMHVGTTEYIFAPQMAWQYGGCLFFVPVTLLVLLCALPMHMLESALGQYTGRGVTVALPRLAPLLRGLAYAQVGITLLISVYLMREAAWLVVYTYYAGHQAVLWHTCTTLMNSRYCYTNELQNNCSRANSTAIYFDFQCVSADEYCHQHDYITSNGSHCLGARLSVSSFAPRWIMPEDNRHRPRHKLPRVQPVALVGKREISHLDFFYHFRQGKDSNDTRPQLQQHRRLMFTLGYTVAWLLALLPVFSLWVASSLAVMLMAASPAITVLIMFRVMLFPGAMDGLWNFFYGRADIRYLASSKCWEDAISMTFWSANIGMGLNTTLNSRNRLRQNILLRSIVVVLCDLTVGFMNSILLFIVRGTLELHSAEMKQQLLELDSDSSALMFVAYTTIVDMLPNHQFWGIIYFGTMLLHTVASVTMMVIGTGLSLADAVPAFGRQPFHAAALASSAPALLLTVAVVVGVWQGTDWSAFELMRIEWMLCCLLSTLALSQKLAKPRFLSELRDTLGQDIGNGLSRLLMLSWRMATPAIALLLMIFLVSRYRWPQVPERFEWLAAVSTLAVLAPVLAATIGTGYACRSRASRRRLLATSARFRPERCALQELTPGTCASAPTACPVQRAESQQSFVT